METIAAARDRGDEWAAAAGSGSAAQRRETVVVLLDEEGLPLGDFLKAYPPGETPLVVVLGDHLVSSALPRPRAKALQLSTLCIS